MHEHLLAVLRVTQHWLFQSLAFQLARLQAFAALNSQLQQALLQYVLALNAQPLLVLLLLFLAQGASALLALLNAAVALTVMHEHLLAVLRLTQHWLFQLLAFQLALSVLARLQVFAALIAQLLLALLQYVFALNAQPRLVQLLLFLDQGASALLAQLNAAVALNALLQLFLLLSALAVGYRPLGHFVPLVVFYLTYQNLTKTVIYFFLPYLLITTYKILIN